MGNRFLLIFFKYNAETIVKTLACHLHDYVEIACLYGFEIRLQLNDQKIVEGKAITTITSANKTECLLLQVNDQSIQVEVIDILSMKAVTPNPHFDLIEFR